MTDKGCLGNSRRVEGMCVVVREKKKLVTVSNMGCLKKTLKIVKSPPSEIFEKPSLELPVVTMNGHIPCSNINKATLYNGFFSSDRSNYDKSDASQDEDDDDDDDFFVNDESSDETESKRKCHSSQQKNAVQDRRSRISRKRLSVEEKLIEDNKSYYRVEVLNSKLRSSEYFVNQKQLESRVKDDIENSSCSEEAEGSREAQQLMSKNVEKSKEPVVVRFKKVRKSQLSVLSDEAESFMFGDSVRREAKKIEYTSPDDSSDSRDSELSSSEDEELPKIKKMVPDSEDGSPAVKDIDSDSLSSPPMLTCDHDSVSESEDDAAKDCFNANFTLDSITFSFENPPTNEPWIETYKRKEDGKNEYYYPYHHDYPKVVLPFEYPVSERLKLLSGKKGPGFGRRRGRRKNDDGKARKSPRCHASTLAVMSNFLKRPLRECSKSSDFSYEEESRSSLPDTVETSSSTSDYRVNSFMSNTNSLPIDPNGDVFAAAIARVAYGETSTLQVSPGPCLAVNPALMDNPPGMDIYLQPGPTVPLEAIIEQHNSDTSWMEYMDYSSANHEQASEFVTCYQPKSNEVNDKAYFKNEPYNWPELPLRRRRKRMKKQEEPRPAVIPSVLIKCEPCEIKLEPMSAKILEHFAVKDEPVLIKEESISGRDVSRFHCLRESASAIGPPPVVKRGRGRPRKKVLPVDHQSPSSELTSTPQPSTNAFHKKSTIPRFSFIQRSFINQIV